ncbi:hypothetical protein CSUI_008172 [Cystoisospora suis]|uniref:Ubiquitin-like domain-containing protein n=1 Tax=Cystoisospora suis TaxID=483139 RepID=A0A2C6KNN8_9APIC|nr:hypothetical protein CSUI_008172 [Cystoisospora suis]
MTLLYVINPANQNEEKKEVAIEAQPDWTVQMLLRYLAEKGIFSSSSTSSSRKRTHPLHSKASLSQQQGEIIVLPTNITLTSDGIVYDLKKRIEEYKSIVPNTKMYITSVPYHMATRIFIVFAETGETFDFEMWSGDRVEELERSIERRLGVEISDMILVHRGEELDACKTIEEQLVPTDALVYLLLKSQKPPLPLPPPPSASQQLLASSSASSPTPNATADSSRANNADKKKTSKDPPNKKAPPPPKKKGK